MLKTKIIIAVIVFAVGTTGIALFKLSLEKKTELQETTNTEMSIKMKKNSSQKNGSEEEKEDDYFKDATEYTKVKPKTLEEIGVKGLGE